jgi:two-component system, chemotaxis family, protein-glutamate methylesterase/glutaminase
MDGPTRLATALASRCDLLAIGASSGGIEAFQRLLPSFAPEVPFAVVLVVHRPAHGPGGLQRCLSSPCPLPLTEVEDKEPVSRAHAYLAPGGYHTLIEREGTFALSVDDPVHYSRPAIDVLFESAARAYGERTVGILLTGANADGAAGLAAIEAVGGLAIVQDPSTAAASEMPTAGLRTCRAPIVLTLDEIARALRMQVEGA